MFSSIYFYSQSQVADLDDEFAELLLTDFSESFDAVPSIKVSAALHGTTIYPYRVALCLVNTD